jgi:hypothetical protein
MAINPFGAATQFIGGAIKKSGTVLKEGAKEAGRAALYSSLTNSGNQSLSQRVGGAIGETVREATFGKMGALGKAITGGNSKRDKSSAGTSSTSGGGVQGQGIKYQQVKTDNVITAINQSAQQVVGALNTLNATQRMGFNAQTNQIQAQAQALDSVSGFGEDTVITLREIYDLLNKQDYEGKSTGAANGSSIPAFTGGAQPPEAANDNRGGGIIGGAITGALAGGALAAGGAALGGAKKLLAKGSEKALLKTALKALPGIGVIAGLAFGANRLLEGDILGAGGEVLSGVLGLIPGIGTAASLAVTGGLAARDMGALGDASQANAGELTTTNNSELSQQEINQLFQAAPVGISDEELLALAQKMFPGRKYGTLKAHIKKLHDMMGQSTATSNVQLASNEILPGMLGSGDYLSQRQQQMDTSRQEDSGVPVLSGTFGSDTSEGALREQEANLEKSATQNPNKIEITARDIVYKADTLTFDVNTIKFVQGSSGGGTSAGTGGGDQDSSVAAPPSTTTPGGTGPTAGPNGPNSGPSTAGTAVPGPPGKFRPSYGGVEKDISDDDLINIIGNEARSSNESIDAVINNMMNRLGSSSYGKAQSLSEVAKQKNQYESWDFLQSGRFKPVSKERAEKIKERLRLIASGQVEDSTGGANEFRARSYLEGEGRGKTFDKKARAQGFRDLGGNVYADTGYEKGPFAAYSVSGQTPPATPDATPVQSGETTQSSSNQSGSSVPTLSGTLPQNSTQDASKSNSSAAGLSFASHVNKNINTGIAGKIKEIQGAFGQTLNITSGYRDPAYNKKVGGAKKSAHMRKNAVDVKFNGGIPETLKLIKTASQMGIGGIGVYSPGKVHLDTENRRAWGPSYGRSSVPAWAEEAIRAHESGQMGAYDPSAAGASGQDATMETSGGGGGGPPSAVPSSGGASEGGGGMGNPLTSMLGGGSSPFGMIGNLLGGVVGEMSKSTSLASAAPPSAPATSSNVNVSSRLPDRSRREGPSSRNPSPGMDDVLAGLIKQAFG